MGCKMEDYTLEKEFENYKKEHQKRILQSKIEVYYQTVKPKTIFPFLLKFSSRKQAEKDVCDLLEKAPQAFEQLYERAWNEYAECLP